MSTSIVLRKTLQADKVRELPQGGRIVAMAGDGINDARHLAAADIGIAVLIDRHLSPAAAAV